MNDREKEIIDRYGLDLIKTGRCKGAMLLETRQGYYLMREYNGTIKHLEFEENLLNKINEFGELSVDSVIRDTEGNLINEDDMGKKYIIRNWYNGKDCDSKNQCQIIKSVKALAVLHNIMNKISYGNIYLNEYFDLRAISYQIENEFERHNIELKKARNYIRRKQKKNDFELQILSKFDIFYEDALRVCELSRRMNQSEFVKSAVESGRMVHGSYNYHNIMFDNDYCIITNFEKTKCSVQVRDLYDFMRKVLEKNQWNRVLGATLIEEYNKIRPMSEQEMKYLTLKLMYPEKFWKLINHYYNNNKAWIPDKDMAKLTMVINQHSQRMDFINEILNLN